MKQRGLHAFWVLLIILAASGAQAFASKNVTTCNPIPGRNAIPNDGIDDSFAIQTCLNTAGSEAAIYFPPGDYVIATGLIVAQNNVTLYTDGVATARLRYTGCGGDLIRYRHGLMTSFRGKVKNLWLLGNGTCAQTAIHGVDTSWFSIEDVQISEFVDPVQEASVGVQNDGREGFNMRNVFIEADNPVVMGKNPNYPTIDVDHVHIENLYSRVPGGHHWHITLRDGVFVTGMTIDGAISLAGGCGAFKWIVSTAAPAGISSHLKMSGMRTEQLVSDCDKTVDIELPVGRELQELVIENNEFLGPFPAVHNAIYLNNVDSVTVSDTSYFNSAAPLSAPAKFINANGAKRIELRNNYFFVTSTITTAAPVLTWITTPVSGKECCNPSGVRSPDSGILAQFAR